jgi:hypothetical protein
MSDTTTEVKAGRELDALIAEKIMGYTDIENRAPDGGNSWWGNPPAPCEHGTRIPYYSTYMGDAWEVVEHMMEQGYYINIFGPGHQGEGDMHWTVNFWSGHYVAGKARELILPLAICQAALEAALQPSGTG